MSIYFREEGNFVWVQQPIFAAIDGKDKNGRPMRYPVAVSTPMKADDDEHMLLDPDGRVYYRRTRQELTEAEKKAFEYAEKELKKKGLL